MGYYVINNLIKERINKMSKETLKQTVNTITHLDSMKAVKVAFDLSESNQDSINKIMQVVHGNVNNINLLVGIFDIDFKLISPLPPLRRLPSKFPLSNFVFLFVVPFFY